MKLWLVRHAQPLAEPGLCYGRTDLPADPQATRQAAAQLANALPPDCLTLASPLQRCEQLVQATSGLRPDLVLNRNPDLAEMDFGDWEGRRWEQIAMDAWMADFWTHRPGGGESVQAFMARVARAFDETVARGRDTAWITHAGVIRAARLIHGGTRVVTQASQWPAGTLPFGGWQLLDC